MSQSQSNIAENPWFWLALFGGMGLLGVVVIAPKFGVRWARVERMQETRERVAQEKAARLASGASRVGGSAVVAEPPQAKPTDAPPKPEPYVESDFEHSVSLKYLLGLMIVVMMIGTTGLLITRGRERRAAMMPQSPATAIDGSSSNVLPVADSSKADA